MRVILDPESAVVFPVPAECMVEDCHGKPVMVVFAETVLSENGTTAFFNCQEHAPPDEAIADVIHDVRVGMRNDPETS